MKHMMSDDEKDQNAIPYLSSNTQNKQENLNGLTKNDKGQNSWRCLTDVEDCQNMYSDDEHCLKNNGYQHDCRRGSDDAYQRNL